MWCVEMAAFWLCKELHGGWMSIHVIDGPKDSNEILDYSIDLGKELSGRGANGSNDTITSVAWFLPASLQLQASSHTDSIATAFLGGGEVGKDYVVRAEIHTTVGRLYNRSFILNI